MDMTPGSRRPTALWRAKCPVTVKAALELVDGWARLRSIEHDFRSAPGCPNGRSEEAKLELNMLTMETPCSTNRAAPALPKNARPKPVRLTVAATRLRIGAIMAYADGKLSPGVRRRRCSMAAASGHELHHGLRLRTTKPFEEVMEEKGVQDLHRPQGHPVPDRHRKWTSCRKSRGRGSFLQQPQPDFGVWRCMKAFRSRPPRPIDHSPRGKSWRCG